MSIPFGFQEVLAFQRRGLEEVDAVIAHFANTTDVLHHRPFERFTDVLLEILDMLVVHLTMILPDQLAKLKPKEFFKLFG
jgi:hypothetical protein